MSRFVLIVLASLVQWPPSNASGLGGATVSQRQVQNRRPKPAAKGATQKKPRSDYTQFSHTTHVTTQKLACDSCHKFPTKNWKDVRKGEAVKTNWETHPNNIGHLYSSGCFRCHDGEHVSNTGKLIRNDCNICHTVLTDSARPSTALPTLSVQHPVDLGGLADRKCETCHKANEPFRHPVNLGDISSFQCVECHPKKS